VQHDYSTGGTFSATVRVTDDDGSTDIASIAINVWTWDVYIVDSNVGGAWDVFGSLAVVAGNPAIVYIDRYVGGPSVGSALKSATGGALTCIWTVSVAVAPSSSVTRSFAVKSPWFV